MKLIKTILGTLAVLFSIQPLATWAADKGPSTSNPEKLKITIPARGESKEGKGSPTCGGG